MKKENIALGIFLVFIVGAGVYFYSLETAPQNVTDTNPPVVHKEPQQVVVTNPPPTVGNILGSKTTKNGIVTTYENLDWNFSVRYPSSYVIQENKKLGTSDFGGLTVTKYHNWDYRKGPPPPSLSISVLRQTESKIFTDPVLYTKKIYSLPPYHENDPSDTITVEPIVVNGVSGAEMLRSEETEEGHVDSRTLIFIKNSSVYQISYFPSNDADYNKIVDSFVVIK